MLSRNFVGDSEKRRRQIDTLKIFNDNVHILKENSEYRIEFVTGTNQMSLDVILGANFPHEKPILLIRPQIIHPWVAEDSSTIVAAPGLINYTIHSDLGRIVQAIIREFEQNPPKLLEESNKENMLNLSPCSNTAHLSPSFPVGSPPCALTFSELQSLSIDELNNLNDSVDLQDKFIETLPQSIEINKIIKEQMEEIEQLAKENLSKQSKLDELRSDIIEKINTFNDLKNTYETLQNKYENLCTLYTPKTILAALEASTLEADEESDSLVESFLQRELDCDTFLKQYEVKRSLGHNRRARHERFILQSMS